MKKIISIIISLCLLLSMSVFNASAFGGYMHWTIASTRMDLDDAVNLSDDIKLAYKSGCLLADIGAALMDHYKDFDTDEYNFTRAIYNSAMSQDDDLAKAFAFGWRDHYIQDKTGDANHLYYDDGSWGPYDSYLINYGWIDEYLRDEAQIITDYPIQNNAISEMYVNYDLIQAAYRSLGDSAPFKTTINANIISMCIMFDSFILLNTKTWTNAQINRILVEILALGFSSIGIAEAPPPASFDTNGTNNLHVSEIFTAAATESDRQLSRDEQIFSLITEEEMTELSEFYEIKSTPISDGAAILRISKKNITGYNNKLNNILSEKALCISETKK